MPEGFSPAEATPSPISLLGVVSAILILALSIPLFWSELTTFRAGLALSEGPEQALTRSTDRGDLLASVAERRADAAETPGQFEAAARMARRALLLEPMENKALLVLALDADRRGKPAETLAMMRVLGGRGLRNTQTQLWLGEHALEAGDHNEAFLRFDAALRRDPTLSEVIFPVLAETLEDPAALGPLAARLAEQPPWRTHFVLHLVGHETGPGRAEALFAAVARTGAQPTEAEVGALVSAILAAGDYRRARDTWTASLPGRASAAGAGVYDGDFKGAPGSPPFNWRLAPGNAAVSERSTAPDGRSALHLQYRADRGHLLAEQLMVLVAGHYRLSGLAWVGDGDAPVSLTWALSCAEEDQSVLGEARLDHSRDRWRPFTVDVLVPETGCVAQQLRLTSRAEDSFATAEAWMSGIRIENQP